MSKDKFPKWAKAAAREVRVLCLEMAEDGEVPDTFEIEVAMHDAWEEGKDE